MQTHFAFIHHMEQYINIYRFLYTKTKTDQIQQDIRWIETLPRLIKHLWGGTVSTKQGY